MLRFMLKSVPPAKEWMKFQHSGGWQTAETNFHEYSSLRTCP